MNASETQPEKLQELIMEMNRSLRSLALQAASHGIVDDQINFWLHNTNFETLPVDEALEQLKKVSEGRVKEWSFLHVG